MSRDPNITYKKVPLKERQKKVRVPAVIAGHDGKTKEGKMARLRSARRSLMPYTFPTGLCKTYDPAIRTQLITWATEGATPAELASLMGVSDLTLSEWITLYPDFADLWALVCKISEAWYVEQARRFILGQNKIGDPAMLKFVLASQFNWRPKIDVKADVKVTSAADAIKAASAALTEYTEVNDATGDQAQ